MGQSVVFRYPLGCLGWHSGGVPLLVRVALVLVVMASLTVLAQPPGGLAPFGVVNPGEPVIVATVVAVVLLLLGVALSGPAGPQGAATLGLLVAAAVVAGAAVGSAALPDLVSSGAWLVSLMLVPGVVQMSLAWPRAWPERPVEGWIAATTWTVVGVVGVTRVAVWDPFADATCLLGCGDNPLALHSDPQLARLLLDALLVGTVAGCAATAALVLRPGRFWVGGAACVVLAADGILRLCTDGPLPRATALSVNQARCVALALVGGALAIAGWARLRRHGRLRRLAAELDAWPTPGTYAASLGQALGDPTLRIDYPANGHHDVVRSKDPLTPPTRPGQATTLLVRSGATVALITHDVKHAEALSAALGPAAMMAIDNERLQVNLRSRLDELRASRERIVESGDAERLRLERDLHDGAQQRLLMIAYELQLASRGDPRLAGALEPVNRDVQIALDELRDIAHGIYPGILESLGLPAALGALVDGPVPFEVDIALPERLPAPVERAVYHIVSTALDHPQHIDGGPPATVRAAVGLHGDSLDLHLSSLGTLPPTLVQRWQDRVGALNGDIRIAGSRLECELPCV